MRRIQTVLSARDVRLAFAVSRFNERVTKALLEGALEAYARLGGDLEQAWTVWVPGSFELPLTAQKLAQRPEIDGVVALGAVIRGETPHFEYVSAQAASGLMQAMLANQKPVAFGVLTTDTPEQAEARAGGKAGNKGAEALYSAVEMVQLLRALQIPG
ncbi:MAG: 6,7-dimethyl-8-ribityllumazine synthase [Meiothermus sp.]